MFNLDIRKAALTALTVIIFSSSHAARAQDGSAPFSDRELTLNTAVDIALRTNPLTRAAASGREIAEAQLAEVKAGRLPLVQVGQTFARSNNPVFVFGTLLEQGRFGPQNFAIDSLNKPDSLSNFRSSISLSLPLFDQFRSRTRIAQARLEGGQAEAQQDLAAQQIRFEVIRAYYGVLVSEAQKRVADEAFKTAEADAKRIRNLFDQGLVVGSDLLAMEVQSAEFRQQQIQAAGNVVVAYAALNRAMGLPVDAPQKLSGAVPEGSFDLARQDELIKEALKNRPDYKQAQMSLQMNEEGVRGSKGEYMPKVDLFASLGNSGTRLFNGSGDYTFGFSMTFNLFDRGREARLRKARAGRDAADAELKRKADEISFEVVQAYQNFKAAQERIQVAAKAVGQAAETLRIVQDRHEVGLTAITEVLRSQTSMVRAQMNLLAARYDYIVGYAQAMLAGGRLNDVAPFAN